MKHGSLFYPTTGVVCQAISDLTDQDTETAVVTTNLVLRLGNRAIFIDSGSFVTYRGVSVAGYITS